MGLGIHHMGGFLAHKDVVQAVFGLIFLSQLIREHQRELINWIRQRGYKGDISQALY